MEYTGLNMSYISPSVGGRKRVPFATELSV